MVILVTRNLCTKFKLFGYFSFARFGQTRDRRRDGQTGRQLRVIIYEHANMGRSLNKYIIVEVTLNSIEIDNLLYLMFISFF